MADHHPIKDVMTTAMENLKEMIDVNTIVGDPVETPDGGVILTVSKVGFGFAMGGSEFNASSDGDSQAFPFGGGSGGGVSITPIAFLIVNKHGVNMLHLEQKPQLIEKLIDLAPSTIEKIQQMTNHSKHEEVEKEIKKESTIDYDI
ncbi:GerW family sporulation protein [Bacillus sp. FJAT-50079]|uniref:GerW family sporulation protein n=1 Tax=Bacillus sp. FJAT-50079 TaxID=2833577 RepID=UPI001BC9EE67|nr:GerW family sporulation protein [Bacillus sp. FJAT-50079]MBS4208755.1 GerW family sporulation protein [Bacillus sp. FJAT-50079]